MKTCSACKQDALQLPIAIYLRSQVLIYCRSCSTSYVSSTHGVYNELRNLLAALFGTLLAFSLFFVISFWPIWLLAVVVVELLNMTIRYTLHRRSIKKLESPYVERRPRSFGKASQ